MSEKPISPRRQRMIEDMTVRNCIEKTRNDYSRHVRSLAAFLRRSPDTATPEDLRRFQLHQTQTNVRPPSINASVAALRFFFTVTLDRPDMARYVTVVREQRCGASSRALVETPPTLRAGAFRILINLLPRPRHASQHRQT
jgi:integrase/recombinase XerD